MRAVNLIPAEARRGGTDLRSLRGPGAAVVGILATALVLVTLYVLASNSVTTRQVQLANLRHQLSQTQAMAANLSGYTKFAKLAQARVETVRQIVSSRFDWQRALSQLSRVIPANTTLSALSATVSPAAGTGSSASGSGLRGDLPVPAFELQGCTASQDDVARLMSRLRLINGVTRVTLASAVKSSSPVTGASVSSSSGPGGCKANAPTFDVVVFFQSPGGAPTAATVGAAPAASGSTPASGGTASTSSTTSTTPAPPASGGAQ